MNLETSDAHPILVTGATGYVGGRLVPKLLERGHRVRRIVREPRKLDERVWRSDPGVEVIQSDLTDASTLANQIRGCSVAYYLIHTMVAPDIRDESDLQAAIAFNKRQQMQEFDESFISAGLVSLAKV